MEGDGIKANTALSEAYNSNKYVSNYLTKKEFLPFTLPNSYSWGNENEAITYAHGAIKAWQNTPGAVEWIEKRIK